MRRLLAGKLTALKLIDQLSGPLHEVLSDATHSDASDISTNSFTVNINQVDETNPGTALDTKIMIMSPELHKEHLRLRALHSFPADADFVVGARIMIKPEAIPAVQMHLEELKEFTKYMLPDPSLVSIVFEDNYLCVGFNLTVFLKIGNLIEKHEDIIKRVQQELKVD